MLMARQDLPAVASMTLWNNDRHSVRIYFLLLPEYTVSTAISLKTNISRWLCLQKRTQSIARRSG